MQFLTLTITTLLAVATAAPQRHCERPEDRGRPECREVRYCDRPENRDRPHCRDVHWCEHHENRDSLECRDRDFGPAPVIVVPPPAPISIPVYVPRHHDHGDNRGAFVCTDVGYAGHCDYQPFGRDGECVTVTRSMDNKISSFEPPIDKTCTVFR